MANKSVREKLIYRKGEQLPDAGSILLGPKGKKKADKERVRLGKRLDALQERLYAEATQSVLLVLQGMDTSGKGGTISHVAGLVNPQGLKIASFKAPTKQERAHDFLLRTRRELPAPGEIGVFDRSHYEDVLVARVDRLAPAATWRKRYAEINAFERELEDNGVHVVKCFLHISPDTQDKRLRARLTTEEKRWKYNPSDIDSRRNWPDYERAYADMLARCSTVATPWYVVPSDHKWYRNWAVAQLLAETLEDMDPRFPEPGYDVATELERLDNTEIPRR
jgi:PPK2 family polyphosphate:nucleotide phosphotransferase